MKRSPPSRKTVGGKRDRQRGFQRAVDAGDDGDNRSCRGHYLLAKLTRGGGIGGHARLGDHHRTWFHRMKRGRRIRPFGLDDREGAGGAERRDQVGRRAFGDEDHRTLQRHRCARGLQYGAPR